MTPQELARFHGPGLTGRVKHLNARQKLQVAECAFDYGFIDTASVLDIDVEELTACMVECGYAQCAGCEEWKEAGELGTIAAVEGESTAGPMCEDCRG